MTEIFESIKECLILKNSNSSEECFLINNENMNKSRRDLRLTLEKNQNANDELKDQN